MKTLFAVFVILFIVSMVSCGRNANLYLPKGDKGDTGTPGVTGATGPTGATGQGCTVTPLDPGPSAQYGGAVIECGGTPVVVKNGPQGAEAAYNVVRLVDPCGQSGNHDEVFFCLNNGDLVASFSANANGDYTRFTILRSGVGYGTTDQTGCVFSATRTGPGEAGSTALTWSGGGDVCMDNTQ